VSPPTTAPALEVTDRSWLGARTTTRDSRQQAVERTIGAMRTRLGDPLSHDELASIAFFSPYHFNRIFRMVTGVPPLRFLTALRMAEAKRLLLTTSMRVTDVCFTVGFESLGTFTTRFGHLVGVAPQQLRWLADCHGDTRLDALDAGSLPTDVSFAAHACGVSGVIDTLAGDACVTFVGLFDTAVPEGPPVACAVVPVPGGFQVGPAPPGRYFVLAIGYPRLGTVREALLADPRELLVGSVPWPVTVDSGRPGSTVRVDLRPPLSIDPPAVLAAPALVADREQSRAAAESAISKNSIAALS